MTGLRKWGMGMAALTFGFVLAMTSQLTPEFVTLAFAICGVHAYGNIGEHKAKAGN